MISSAASSATPSVPLDTAPACPLRVGTSGYAYPEWSDAGFYPPGTPAREMLALYARQFSVTELNYTWYQMPRAAAMERMLPKVPADFGFAAKLTRTMTHEIDPHGWRDKAVQFRDGIAPLMQAGRLLSVLIQLPPTFERNAANRRYLAHLLDALAGLPLAVEFRHRTWAVAPVFGELQRRRVTLVAVDAPDLPYLFPTAVSPFSTTTCAPRRRAMPTCSWQNSAPVHPAGRSIENSARKHQNPWTETSFISMWPILPWPWNGAWTDAWQGVRSSLRPKGRPGPWSMT